MYSSIKIEERIEVVQKCYWPLFKLVDQGFPIGIEAPALTLQIINKIDPGWIDLLAKYINDGKIEFIGSGYSQIIGPLVPAKVNDWNQVIGLEVYKQLLGTKPKIALINEMAYSAGIIEHYMNTGYEAIIMEWNNPRSANSEWKNEWRYYPQKAIGTYGENIPLIWADSITFQKFQRYAHGEYEMEEYIQYIKSQIGEFDRFFPLYSNDVEIFDNRPGRYQTEPHFDNNSEWDRIIELFTYLKKQNWCDFVFPNQVLSGLNDEFGGNELKLESPSQPIPVKKQEKYNINRWALTGRDDLQINTSCYAIYNYLIAKDEKNPESWKNLCYLWSSDFRTHITDRRWKAYQAKLNAALVQLDKSENTLVSTREKSFEPSKINETRSILSISNSQFDLELNKKKGMTIKTFVVKEFSPEFLIGTLDHGYYDDISLGADYYSGHAIIERLGEHKFADLQPVEPKILRINDRIEITSTQSTESVVFKNKITATSWGLILEKTITYQSPEKSIIHPINFTFNPKAWDVESLYVKTHNGGVSSERFFLKGQTIAHGDIYSSLISARHGFGNTEGVFIVGDRHKQLKFECDMSRSALIPSIVYQENKDTIFFRLQYSACEIDETSRANNCHNSLELKLSISCRRCEINIM